MTLDEVQSILGFELPNVHAFAIANPGDPIHSLCDFLVIDTPHQLLSLVHVNAFLHGDTKSAQDDGQSSR